MSAQEATAISAAEAARYRRRRYLALTVWILVFAAALVGDGLLPGVIRFASGLSILELVSIIAGILVVANVLKLASHWVLVRRNRPSAEGVMIGRLYNLLAVLAIILTIAYGAGKLGAFGAVFAAFGGMLLGWSLQAPVSGFAAWVLVSLKRPFRPGDRIQFPNLGLTGDVKDVGIMYTMLNQVGGTIGSEEAVGRYILVPNAMLFSQVVINYTVMQGSPYMLDEVVVRITYDSDWQEAERMLIKAAREATADIIETTGVQPYVRSDMYDYGVYLRLRYQTRVKDRAEIATDITKRIFMDFQKSPRVDFAIPFIYSFRAALERREDEARAGSLGGRIQEIDIARIQGPPGAIDDADVAPVAKSIASHGLLQPIVVTESDRKGYYEILAGNVRFEACKRLGWRSVPALVQARRPGGMNQADSG